MTGEFVSILSLDPVCCEHRGWKVPAVLGHDYVRSAYDGSREDVAVIRVRKHQAVHLCLVSASSASGKAWSMNRRVRSSFLGST